MDITLTAPQQRIYNWCVNTPYNILYYGPGGSGKTLVSREVINKLHEVQGSSSIRYIENIYSSNDPESIARIIRSICNNEWNIISTIIYNTAYISKLHLENLSWVLQTLTGNWDTFGGKRVIIECTDFDSTNLPTASMLRITSKHIYVHSITNIINKTIELT